MNRKRKSFAFRAPVFIAAFSLAVLCSSASHRARRQTFSVSIPNLPVGTKERIVGFEIHVSSGRTAALPNIPIGWNLSVDNDPSWKTELEASSRVGASALAPGFFRNFLCIEKNESLGLPFGIAGEISVTEDFVKARKIPVAMKDIDLKQTVARNDGACN
jgi:hypothetical protein